MKSELLTKLELGNAGRKSRVAISSFVIRKDHMLPDFIAIAFDVTDINHVKAFWSLEILCERKLKLFVPYIDDFCQVLPVLKEDSAIRPATKICLFLAKSNQRKNGITLSQEQEHNLIEVLIDRLIQDEKVATKVYAMKALYVLGRKYSWVHDELKIILPQDYPNHSAAYQASTRIILKKLNK